MFSVNHILFVSVAVGGSLIASDVHAYRENPDVRGVSVKGRITFSGEIPEPKQLQVNRDSEYCGKTMPDESFQVDLRSKGILHVIVNLKEISNGKPHPKKSLVTINNQACRFQPSVNIGNTGSTLEIRSSDPILHNTHILHYDNTFLNVALPPGGRTIRKTIEQSGRLKVRCDAHGFMQAYIHIFDHPYFALSNRTGQFELTEVPPGTYDLQFWHQSFGLRELSITVTEASPVTVDVTFP